MTPERWRRLASSPVVLVPVAVGVLCLAVGVLAGGARSDDSETVARLRRTQRAQQDRAARLQAERNRLRAERNQLEARLASNSRASICPAPTLSSGDAGLIPWFVFDYPCGWHVVYDARGGAVSEEDHPGLIAEAVLMARLPIALTPRQAPLADIEVVDWSDDPADERDSLRALDEWLADERARFTTPPRESQTEADDGITIHRFSGEQKLFEETVPVVVLVWEYEDGVAGRRHVARALAASPTARVRAALDLIARSFQVVRR